MGNSTSTDKEMYLSILDSIINQKGKQIKKAQLLQFLKIVGEYCPWFCEQESPNLSTWEKLGRKLQKVYFSNELPGGIESIQKTWTALEICLFEYMGQSSWPPEDLLKGLQRAIKSIQMENSPEAKLIPFPLGRLKTKTTLKAKPKVRNVTLNSQDYTSPQGDSRDEYHRGQTSEILESPQEEVEDLPTEENPEEIPRGAQSSSPPRGLETQIQNDDSTESDHDLQSEGEESDMEIQDLQRNLNRLRLTPPVQTIRIQPVPAKRTKINRCAGLTMTFLTPFQRGIKKAQEDGEDTSGFQLFPVFEQVNEQDQRVRVHAVIPFKTIKELKSACETYGPNSPFVQSLIENICSQPLPPSDWISLARSCLSGGDFLLWRTYWTDFCTEQAEKNKRQDIETPVEMFLGTGEFTDLERQLNYDFVVYNQITNCAKRAWRQIVSKDQSNLVLSKIRQGASEPYSDFVARLYQAANRSIGDSGASEFIVRQLAFENANKYCQDILRPHRKKGTVSEFIRLCSDIDSTHLQTVALAAAIKETLKPQDLVRKPRGKCYICGRNNHFARECRMRNFKFRAPSTGDNRYCKAQPHAADQDGADEPAFLSSFPPGRNTNFRSARPRAENEEVGGRAM
ncbi:endogenous retrovirus group K member 10 Gag polyprotein-like [Marmota flaviventris]|uniref:endogenous retrovirus group K member 10 Gag polyprotein-like n=1 Tax=Marmota flaviventris TaxID=93162 RepID=UPI003A8BA2BF